MAAEIDQHRQSDAEQEAEDDDEDDGDARRTRRLPHRAAGDRHPPCGTGGHYRYH